MASEIELQTVRWIAQLLGYPEECGGLLVSGGNMANLVGFWVGRRVGLEGDLRATATHRWRPARLRLERDHTWIQKATDLRLRTESARWIATDARQRMTSTRSAAGRRRRATASPMVADGGPRSTGAIDCASRAFVERNGSTPTPRTAAPRKAALPRGRSDSRRWRSRTRRD
jgi:glutamate/tyrosine decarboxylase-like PLP-dependent enzyme